MTSGSTAAILRTLLPASVKEDRTGCPLFAVKYLRIRSGKLPPTYGPWEGLSQAMSQLLDTMKYTRIPAKVGCLPHRSKRAVKLACLNRSEAWDEHRRQAFGHAARSTCLEWLCGLAVRTRSSRAPG